MLLGFGFWYLLDSFTKEALAEYGNVNTAGLPLHELGGHGGNNVGYYLGCSWARLIWRHSKDCTTFLKALTCFGCRRANGPHSSAVKQVVQGPSCGDVLQAMQHEPKLMFETLKHYAEDIKILCSEDRNPYAEECGHKDEIASATLECSLVCSFHSMPYLTTALATCAMVNSNAYYYCVEGDNNVEENSRAAVGLIKLIVRLDFPYKSC
ncbi:hypothetical protein NE237_011698 [Protea cynaroides]|uniref:Uncharacterized protein n=1 Tax=Protea cynaroides TaxID=273540 RepID=A0A9Q0GWM7_9MAGN|nr:hypothetical protein NE237_011698 [Protea cynaroides]